MVGGDFQNDFRLVQIGVQRVQRGFDDQVHTHGGGEVINRFCARHNFGKFRAARNGGFDDPQIFMSRYCAQVVAAAGREIVNDHNRFAVGQQAFDEVSADETRAAGDEDGLYAA